MRFKLKVETRMKRVVFVLYTKKVKLKVMKSLGSMYVVLVRVCLCSGGDSTTGMLMT